MNTVRSIISLSLALLLLTSVEASATRVLTLYLDRAQVEQRETARKGYLEIYLPAGAIQDSLRIVPGKGGEILRVVTAPLKPSKSAEKELAQLAEREELLNDRLKALSVREDIFKAAARSQSAKAPRRTKSNPEPLSTLKQGTDYAMTQLESVYQAQRRTEKELAQITERRARFGRDLLSGGTVAKVWITPSSGTVSATWIQSDKYWLPGYQLRIDGTGMATLILLSQGVPLAKGETAELVISTLQSDPNPVKFRYEGEWSEVRKEKFTVSNYQDIKVSSTPLKINFTNTSSVNFPSGEISCFKDGVYMGQGKFLGVDAGKAVEVVCSSR